MIYFRLDFEEKISVGNLLPVSLFLCLIDFLSYDFCSSLEEVNITWVMFYDILNGCLRKSEEATTKVVPEKIRYLHLKILRKIARDEIGKRYHPTNGLASERFWNDYRWCFFCLAMIFGPQKLISLHFKFSFSSTSAYLFSEENIK